MDQRVRMTLRVLFCPMRSARLEERRRVGGRQSSVGRLVQAVLAEQLAEVLAVDLGGARGGREVPFVALELRSDVLALEAVDQLRLGFLERQVEVDGAARRGARLLVERLVDLQLGPVRERARPLDDVAQL